MHKVSDEFEFQPDWTTDYGVSCPWGLKISHSLIMGKWCLHASSFIFDRIIIKVAGNQDRHKSSDEFDFGPLVSMAHLYVFLNEIWPWHIGLRWAIVALWATCLEITTAVVAALKSLSLHWYSVIFSSPDPKAHRWAYSIGSHLSVVHTSLSVNIFKRHLLWSHEADS